MKYKYHIAGVGDGKNYGVYRQLSTDAPLSSMKCVFVCDTLKKAQAKIRELEKQNEE